MLARASSRVRAAAPRVVQTGVRNYSGRGPGSSPLSTVYHVAFKRTYVYLSVVIATAIVADATYGGIWDGMWSTLNHGKTYDTIDWSKWESPLDEEDDDDDEDEDED